MRDKEVLMLYIDNLMMDNTKTKNEALFFLKKLISRDLNSSKVELAVSDDGQIKVCKI